MSIVEILKVIVLGIVEGFTEWLPISSTGHMILVDEIIHLNQPDAFKDMFLVVIQLGAILAVAVMYFQKLNPFSPSKSARQKQATWALWIKIVIACIPAAVLGLLFDDWMEAHLYNAYVVAATLIIYGLLFIALENSSIKANPSITKVGHVSTKTALFIGLFQLLSLVPGTSRSGATIVGALLLGGSRTAAAAFAFFLAIPAMFGASLLKLVKSGLPSTGMETAMLLIGMISAFVVSIVVIRFLMSYIKKHDFTVFGWYRIVLGVLVLSGGITGFIG